MSTQNEIQDFIDTNSEKIDKSVENLIDYLKKTDFAQSFLQGDNSRFTSLSNSIKSLVKNKDFYEQHKKDTDRLLVNFQIKPFGESENSDPTKQKDIPKTLHGATLHFQLGLKKSDFQKQLIDTEKQPQIFYNKSVLERKDGVKIYSNVSLYEKVLGAAKPHKINFTQMKNLGGGYKAIEVGGQIVSLNNKATNPKEKYFYSRHSQNFDSNNIEFLGNPLNKAQIQNLRNGDGVKLYGLNIKGHTIEFNSPERVSLANNRLGVQSKTILKTYPTILESVNKSKEVVVSKSQENTQDEKQNEKQNQTTAKKPKTTTSQKKSSTSFKR